MRREGRQLSSGREVRKGDGVLRDMVKRCWELRDGGSEMMETDSGVRQ